MSIDVVIYRQALRQKGEVIKPRHIAKYPIYESVCFSHAVILAINEVKVLEFVEGENDMDKECVVCLGRCKLDDFEKSLFDKDSEYIYLD